jgi:alkanesulfonate monooxygenase SsuD/methylene tetrahydromethanopterin reductase-like flavin-dependent oxidoreductase (luciferase family)
MGEDLGFDIISTTEHHLHTEGLEMGNVPSLYAYLAMQTKHVKVGPIGYVLPAWNPLRLAVEIAWLDQITKGRTIVGLARGYQTRWVDQMNQHAVQVAHARGLHDPLDIKNAAFDEVYEFLKLAWADEPFSYRGRLWEFPFPAGEGTPWAAHGWTARYGDPQELTGDRITKLNVVPKPYQKPHPPLFAALTASNSTVAWAAREGICPAVLGSNIDRAVALSTLYRDAALEAGRELAPGAGIALSHAVAFGSDRADALRRAKAGRIGMYWVEFGGVFGFWEAARVPGDENRWPRGTATIPPSEWSVERLAESGHLIHGTVADVRRRFDEVATRAAPQYFVYGPDQGTASFEECATQLRTFGEQIMPHYLD